MRNYKIAFVVLGSIATRHLKNVHAYLASQGDSCEVDLYRSSLGRLLADVLQPLVSKTYLYAEEIPTDRQYDVVFVTNPTSMHYETIERFAAHTKSFFIEKPVFDSTEVDEINVYVAKDDAVSSVNEAVEKDYIFAIIETDDMTHIQETLDEIEKNEIVLDR